MLNALQGDLQSLYDLQTPHRVEDFLVQDADWVEALTHKRPDQDSPEQLLIQQQGEDLDVALFLDPGVLQRLAQDDPNDALHRGNLQDFCFALEGVSHFLYLVWNAAFERPISQLELELQAEVDKFVTAVQLIHRQGRRRHESALLQALFRRFRLRSEMPAQERHRYREANRQGLRYCNALTKRREQGASNADIARELRRFYRLPWGRKIEHIRRACQGSA